MIKFRRHQPSDPPTARDLVAIQDHIAEGRVDTSAAAAVANAIGASTLDGQLLQSFKVSLSADTIVLPNTNIAFGTVAWGAAQWPTSNTLMVSTSCVMRISARLTLRANEGAGSDSLKPGARAVLFLVDDAGNKQTVGQTVQAVISLSNVAQLEIDMQDDVSLVAGTKYHVRYDGLLADGTTLTRGWQLKRSATGVLIPGCWIEGSVVPVVN